jgi:curved DNA-binding protein CbpA
VIQNLEQHYKVLGLEPGASLEEVNQAYKDLVFIWHPDRLPQENQRLIQKSVEKLQQINVARDSLRSYHRQHGKTPATSQPQSTTYPRRGEYYSGGKTYQNRGQTASSSYRSDKSANYQSYSSSSNNQYRESDRQQRYSQANSKQTSQTGVRQPWDYRAYYYSPNNSTHQSSSHRDGYGDFRESSKSYGASRPTENNHKRPYYKDLRGADLSRSNFKEKDLSGRDLSQANLSYADLSDTFLHKIILEEANLQGANLKGANLLQANLRGANLKEANLIGADLSGADLSGADLSGAKVGFNKKIMVKLTAVKLTGATLPDGSTHP